ncbi:protein NYNRIN-like [Apus apus]|uniref:protein NYNRIN-like n=1 Tax=Apus apus TaxID=8895 RepID=UPI0021F85431|nr:protein NYNRIN-like [Apus apus]
MKRTQEEEYLLHPNDFQEAEKDPLAINRTCAEYNTEGKQKYTNTEEEEHKRLDSQGLYIIGDRSHQEPLIKLRIGPLRQEFTFLVDTGAERSTIRNLPEGCKLSDEKVQVIGAKGEPFKVNKIKDVVFESENKFGVGELLLVPEADFNLLGRDLIVELQLEIKVENQRLAIKAYPLTVKDKQEINPEAWYSPDSISKLDIAPIKVQIQEPQIPVRIKQYPISIEGRKGLKPEIDRLLTQGILEPCMSPFNAPILPVTKSNGKYRLVHDLREINKRTITRFPVVANPYTLLSRLGPHNNWYSVIDLKDAFWACPLAEECRNYFAFEWEDPDTGRRQQLRWTVLPQGFNESPNLFGQALEELLMEYQVLSGNILLQYVDDLLIAGSEKEKVREESIKLLNFLALKGLQVSEEKLQFVEGRVKYLGHYLIKGQKIIDPERIKGILELTMPGNKRQIRQVLGLFGYCRQWIENYSAKVKFLYEQLTKNNLPKWTLQDKKNFENLKKDLSQAPVLSLPDVKRPFQLFVNTDRGTAFGVLTQEWAGKRKPVAYLSKLLDPVSRGWPTCIQIIVAAASLLEEANRITFNGKIVLYTPHNIREVLQQKAEKWLTDSRLLKYEGILIESPKLLLRTVGATNPAEFLYQGENNTETLHDCLQTIECQSKIRPDLEEEELEKGDILFVDGSFRVVEGKRLSGYAIVKLENGEFKVMNSGPLNASWSAQACELYALWKALELLKGKIGTIYTDSKYAYGIVHTFGKIWEERGFINSQGKGLVHEELVRRVLKSLRGPLEIAVVHVKGHQRGTNYRIRGNNVADEEARRVAGNSTTLLMVKETPDALNEENFSFSKKEKEKLCLMGAKEQNRKQVLPDGREVLPQGMARKIMTKIHQKTHWGTQALVDHFEQLYSCIGVYNVAKTITQACETCQKVNRNRSRQRQLGGRPPAIRPFSNIQIDFTELPKVGRYRYLLVIVDHLTHYVEAFPTGRATANQVTKVLLEHIIPRYGVIEVIDSDRGPHFTSKIIKELSECLGIRWDYHTPWHPQSSGRVERLNGEIKTVLTKLMIETKLSWLRCLPMALLILRTRPRSDLGISAYEMVYGMPYNIEKPQENVLVQDQTLEVYISQLSKHREELWKRGLIVQRPPLDLKIHNIKPGDWILIRVWKEETLKPKWEGPFLVLLTTETAVRTTERGWTHASQIKGPVSPPQ